MSNAVIFVFGLIQLAVILYVILMIRRIAKATSSIADNVRQIGRQVERIADGSARRKN